MLVNLKQTQLRDALNGVHACHPSFRKTNLRFEDLNLDNAYPISVMCMLDKLAEDLYEGYLLL